MESFQWDQHFETGLTEVDDQHHVLVDLINRFGELLGTSEAIAWEGAKDVLEELSHYTRYHFQEEEALMQQIGVDPRHRTLQAEAHVEFCHEIDRLRGVMAAQAGAGDQVDLAKAEQLLKFLIHWLVHHILGVDKCMARQVAAIRAGEDPAAAYADQANVADDATEPMLRALNGLIHQVSLRNRELVELNRLLEAKVAERTQALTIANQRLEHMALTDVLTGLPNRRSALARMDFAWDEAEQVDRPLSVMMIDADGFKQINDTYGHDAGDGVLRALSRQLRDLVRSDDVVCRLGGDEFLILCAGTPLESAVRLAETLRRKVADMRVPAGGGKWQGSISVGVAQKSREMKTREALLKAADEAVYRAKKRGRNCVAW